MTEAALANLALTVFVLGGFGVFATFAARFLTNVRYLTVHLGIGPKLLVINLGGLRFRINGFPVFLCLLDPKHISRRQTVIVSWFVTSCYLALTCLFVAGSIAYAAPGLSPGTEAANASPAHGDDSCGVIVEVAEDSAAQRAGLVAGTTVCRFNGRTFATAVDLLDEYLRKPPVLNLQGYDRDGEAFRISIPLEETESQVPPRLGFTYRAADMPLAPGVSRSGEFLWDLPGAMARGAFSTWWTLQARMKGRMQIESGRPRFFSLMLFGTFASTIMMLIALLQAVLDTRHWPVLVLLLSFHPEPALLWIGVSYIFLFLLSRKQAWMPLVALVVFALVHARLWARGVQNGLILELAAHAQPRILWWV